MVNLQPSKFSEANVGNKKQTYDPAPEEVYYKQKNIRYTERQLLEDYARSEYQTSNIDLEKLGQQLAPEENLEQNHGNLAPKYDGNDGRFFLVFLMDNHIQVSCSYTLSL